jgi:uncharacterized protein YqfA (UPF0365 family)
MNQRDFVLFASGFITALILFTTLLPFFTLMRYWIMTVLTGGKVSLMQLIGMRLRGTPLAIVIPAYIALIQSGHPVIVEEVEQTYLRFPGQIGNATDLIEKLKHQR